MWCNWGPPVGWTRTFIPIPVGPNRGPRTGLDLHPHPRPRVIQRGAPWGPCRSSAGAGPAAPGNPRGPSGRPEPREAVPPPRPPPGSPPPRPGRGTAPVGGGRAADAARSPPRSRRGAGAAGNSGADGGCDRVSGRRETAAQSGGAGPPRAPSGTPPPTRGGELGGSVLAGEHGWAQTGACPCWKGGPWLGSSSLERWGAPRGARAAAVRAGRGAPVGLFLPPEPPPPPAGLCGTGGLQRWSLQAGTGPGGDGVRLIWGVPSWLAGGGAGGGTAGPGEAPGEVSLPSPGVVPVALTPLPWAWWQQATHGVPATCRGEQRWHWGCHISYRDGFWSPPTSASRPPRLPAAPGGWQRWRGSWQGSA